MPAPAPRFASEMEPRPVSVNGAGAKVPTARVDHQTELIPVPASVFDDDFFRGASAQEEALEAEMANEVQASHRESAHFTGQNFVQKEERLSTVEEPLVVEASVRTAAFGGAVGASTDLGEPDELDIPAFLRRGK